MLSLGAQERGRASYSILTNATARLSYRPREPYSFLMSPKRTRGNLFMDRPRMGFPCYAPPTLHVSGSSRFDLARIKRTVVFCWLRCVHCGMSGMGFACQTIEGSPTGGHTAGKAISSAGKENKIQKCPPRLRRSHHSYFD